MDIEALGSAKKDSTPVKLAQMAGRAPCTQAIGVTASDELALAASRVDEFVQGMGLPVQF